MTGALVSGTDPGELADVLSRLLQRADERERMGGAARARVERAFTWERAAAAVAAIQDEVMRG